MLENGVLAKSCFALLGKKGKCWKASVMYGFEAKRNRKTKRCKNGEPSTKWHFELSILLILAPKTHPFDFVKNNSYKINNFTLIPKTENTF